MLPHRSSGRQDIYRCSQEEGLVVESEPLEYLIQGIFQISVQTVMQKGWPLVLGVLVSVCLCVCGLTFLEIFF